MWALPPVLGVGVSTAITITACEQSRCLLDGQRHPEPLESQPRPHLRFDSLQLPRTLNCVPQHPQLVVHPPPPRDHARRRLAVDSDDFTQRLLDARVDGSRPRARLLPPLELHRVMFQQLGELNASQLRLVAVLITQQDLAGRRTR